MMHIGAIVATTGRMIKLEFVTGDYGYQAEMFSRCLPPVTFRGCNPEEAKHPTSLYGTHAPFASGVTRFV